MTSKLKTFCNTKKPFPEVTPEDGDVFVVSSGHSVWSDLEKAGFHKDLWKQNAGIIAVNDMGLHLPCHVDHWYSNDTPFLKALREARRPEYMKEDKGYPKTLYHSCFHGGLVDYHWPWPGNGTSAIGAVFCALALYTGKVKVCGVPMDEKGHYFDPPWKTTKFNNEGTGGHRFWKRAFREVFDGRVEIMSGTLSGLSDTEG